MQFVFKCKVPHCRIVIDRNKIYIEKLNKKNYDEAELNKEAALFLIFDKDRNNFLDKLK